MDYPVFIAGEQAGTLRESQSGLYTLFETSLPEDPGGLVRLYVHGGGESAYLGLMTPAGKGLALCRRMSALERRALPAAIAFASDSPKESASVPEAGGGMSESPAPPEDNGLHNATSPPQTTSTACPWPAPVPEGDGDLLWLRCTDGTLRAFDGVSSLVAFPAALKERSPGTALRRIDGADYLVFRR